jgi:hypothetical protein
MLNRMRRLTKAEQRMAGIGRNGAGVLGGRVSGYKALLSPVCCMGAEHQVTKRTVPRRGQGGV